MGKYNSIYRHVLYRQKAFDGSEVYTLKNMHVKPANLTFSGVIMEKSKAGTGSLSLREIALKYKSKEPQPATSVPPKAQQTTAVKENVPIIIDISTNRIHHPGLEPASNHQSSLESNQQHDTQDATENDTSLALIGASRRKPRAPRISYVESEILEEVPDADFDEPENESTQICKVSMVTSLLKNKTPKRQQLEGKSGGAGASIKKKRKPRKEKEASGENDQPLNYCHLCFETFPTKDELSKHLDSAHIGETPFQCEVNI